MTIVIFTDTEKHVCLKSLDSDRIAMSTKFKSSVKGRNCVYNMELVFYFSYIITMN